MNLLAFIVIGMFAQSTLAAGISIDPDTGIDVGDRRVTNVNEPVDPKDATPKQYVDNLRSDVETELAQLRSDMCRLYADVGQPLPLHCPFGYVFVTSQAYHGDLVSAYGDPGLTGVEAADALCQAAANAASPDPLPGVYKAWIAIDEADDPESRFSDVGVPWILVDGTVVATDWANLIDGELMAGIKITETGEDIISWGVWTNVKVDGTANDIYYEYNCEGWTDPTAQGKYGTASAVNQYWTDYSSSMCDVSRRLYCFQQ